MYILLGVLTGAIFIITKTLNMLLAKHVGIYRSNIINHITGLIGALLFVLIFLRASNFRLSDLGQVGIYPLMGGVLGATFVALSNYTFSKTKVLISTLMILVGQTVMSIILDTFILHAKVSPLTIVGAALVIVAVVLYNSKDEKEVTDQKCDDENMIEDIKV